MKKPLVSYEILNGHPVIFLEFRARGFLIRCLHWCPGVIPDFPIKGVEKQPRHVPVRERPRSSRQRRGAESDSECVGGRSRGGEALKSRGYECIDMYIGWTCNLHIMFHMYA